MALFMLLFSVTVLIPVMISVAHAYDITPEITIVSKVMTGIRVTSLPSKTVYYTGEYLAVKGAKLTVDYSDGSSETVDIKAEWCDGFESYTAGTSTVYVRYPEWGDPVTFDVSVVYPSVTYITIKSKPNTTVYYTGQALDTAGISVMATYNNGYIDDVSSEVTYSDIDFSVPAAKKTVTVTYRSEGKKFTASFDIQIIQRAPQSIRITSSPDKTSYFDGEEFDRTGLGVAVVFNDGTEETAADDEIKVTGYDPTLIGGQTLTVSCRGFETTFEVLVNVSGDHVHTPGEKTVEIEPSCTEPGKAVIFCTVCKAVVEEFVIEPKGHSFGEWVTEIAPSVGVPGVIGRTCTVCEAKENLQVDPLYRYVSDADKTITYVLEGEGETAFPWGTKLVRTDIYPILTMGESLEYEKLAGSRSALMLDISLVRIGCPDGAVLPDGNVIINLSAPEGRWKDYILFVNGKEVTSAFNANDGTLRFIMDGNWKQDLIIMTAGVPDRSETETVETTAVPDTEPVSPDTTAPDETAPPDITGNEPTVTDPEDTVTGGNDEPSDTTEVPEGEKKGMTSEQLRATATGIGIVIGVLFIFSCLFALIYKRFIY